MGTAQQISDDTLVAMWHGTQTADRLAFDADMPLAELYRHWRRLKYESRLPDRPRLPSKRPSSYRPAIYDCDGRPTVGADPLLEALLREHSNRTD